jgi:hypothetical protein
MSGCLPEKTLVLVQAGEATEADREHLSACQACGARYQRLIQDLEVIGQALAGAPPPRARSLRAPWQSWVPAAAAGVAVAGALVWGLWLGKAAGPVSPPERGGAEIAPVLQIVSAALFSAIEVSPGVADMAGLHDLGATLEGESSCEGAQAFSPGCEDSSSQDDLVDLVAGDA